VEKLKFTVPGAETKRSTNIKTEINEEKSN